MTTHNKPPIRTIREAAGWIGVSLILAAYSLITLEFITAENLLYGIMNLLGAAGLIFSSLYKRDFQPVLLNIVWLLVAVFGIARSIL